ncbi:TPA: MBL fold metallo-hydrolase [Candidatus Woesearchaeota archaeon]|nr:Zn-dependent hydrolase [archaeon]HIJ10626.1 MBL fold metallo-hydrolase [Candidatus Woesearchaeota archaeon]|tara:strand:+ start:252 stop:845 length:594 start_codon:yes stop_codon:yes gene_type:complete
MHIKTFKGGYDNNFTYLIIDGKECCVLDPAIPSKNIFSFVEKEGLTITFVLFMHSHFDHIVELEQYKEKGIPIYGHESTKIEVDRKVKDNDILTVGETELNIMHTPGHRYDCVCVLVENNVFTSDTLFVGGCGRVDFEGSDPDAMFETLQKLKQLPDETIIYPGHDYGSTPRSTISKEKKQNFFFKIGKAEFLRRRL